MSVKDGTVRFEDYHINVENVIESTALRFLEEIGNEIQSITVRNTVRKTGQTAGSWNHEIDRNALAVHIGSDYENAVWEEFGTGEFSENGKGRKGYWVFIEGSQGSGSGGKTYTNKKDAQKAMAILRKKGLPAYYTKGKKARHPFLRAFNSTKPKIETYAKSVFGGMK